MTLLIGALTMGFILALLALGVYLSFRIFNIPDMTAEGTVTLGASVAAVMMVDNGAERLFQEIWIDSLPCIKHQCLIIMLWLGETTFEEPLLYGR